MHIRFSNNFSLSTNWLEAANTVNKLWKMNVYIRLTQAPYNKFNCIYSPNFQHRIKSNHPHANLHMHCIPSFRHLRSYTFLFHHTIRDLHFHAHKRHKLPECMIQFVCTYTVRNEFPLSSICLSVSINCVCIRICTKKRKKMTGSGFDVAACLWIAVAWQPYRHTIKTQYLLC